MGEQAIRELLTATAEPVGPAYLAEPAWRLAGVRRRRNRLVGLGAGVAVVALVAVGLTVSRDVPPRPVRGDAPSAARTGEAGGMPVTIIDGTAPLPAVATTIPSTVDTDPAHALPLSRYPVGHALGVFVPYPAGWPRAMPTYSTVLVLGEDGRMRRVDTVPVRSSGDGLAPGPVTSGALDLAGRTAAFPQPGGAVLTVDLQGTGHRLYRVGADVRSVRWSGDDTLILGSEDGTRMLDVHSGHIDRYAYTDVALAQDLTTVEPLVGLTGTTISGYRYGARHPSTTTVRLPAGLHGWYGDAWTNVARMVSVVRASFGQPFTMAAGETVVALQAGRSTPKRALTVSYTKTRGKTCCTVLGWPKAGDVVLVDDHVTTGHRILAWNIDTGDVRQVTRLTRDAQVALAPSLRLPRG